MTRIMMVSIVCSLLALASFGILMLEDVRLGIPLPYSLPLAFAGSAVLAPALLAFFERLRAKRTIIVHVERPADAEQAVRRPRRTGVEGVVLLDHASIAACRKGAA